MPLAIIRRESDRDIGAVRNVHDRAFGQPAEGRLVDRLREAGLARISLLLEVDEQVVGHILFSRLTILSDHGELEALALAPLAVLPEFQHRGLGSQLMDVGLKECARRGYGIVVVLGEPEFYQRFGFSTELARGLECEYSGSHFMALELASGALHLVRGKVIYPPPFQAL